MRTQLRSDTSLLEFWEATRLSDDARYPDQAEPTAGTDEAIRAALAGVLGHGCGQRVGTVLAKGGTFVQARTTPSAGALYPFEVLVGLSDGERCVSYLYEVDSGQLNSFSSAPPVPLAELVAQAGLADVEPAPVRAVITLVARPWTSMAKYGRRGYLYTYLDIGHAATNLALAARAAGLKAVIHLRFRRQWLAHALGLAGTCREPQAVVTITAPEETSTDRPAADPPADGDGVVTPVWRDRRQARLEPPGDPERRNFEALRDISLAYAPAAVARPGRIVSVTEPPPPADVSADVVLRRPGSVPGDHAALAVLRQSAKGFLPAAVSLDQLAASSRAWTGSSPPTSPNPPRRASGSAWWRVRSPASPPARTPGLPVGTPFSRRAAARWRRRTCWPPASGRTVCGTPGRSCCCTRRCARCCASRAGPVWRRCTSTPPTWRSACA
ncbi:nitroreductase family protein [Micromonospora sp. STR1s_5]|nr:nitroreductase family protein [Micromonospora sp. STR1s_5]